MTESRPLGFGRRDAGAGTATAEAPVAVPTLDDKAAAALLPARHPRGHKGTFGKLLVIDADKIHPELRDIGIYRRIGAGVATKEMHETGRGHGHFRDGPRVAPY